MKFKSLILSLVFLSSVVGGADLQYILYIRPTGALGGDLATYWDQVRNSDLSHKAITKYPPHCTLTSFFVPDPLHDLEFYISAIQTAVDAADALYPRSVSVSHNLVLGKELDYIKLSSAYLTALASAYLTAVGLPQSYLKGPPGFTFHITLREIVFKTAGKLQRIQKLEKKINLAGSAGWTIYLYKQENDVLYALASYPLINP